METSPGAKLVGFVTHSTYTPEGGERERRLHERWAGKCVGTFEQACAVKGLVWGGYFGCQGAPSKPIEIFIRRAAIKDPGEWPGYIAETRKHPNTQDEARARVCPRCHRADPVAAQSSTAAERSIDPRLVPCPRNARPGR